MNEILSFSESRKNPVWQTQITFTSYDIAQQGSSNSSNKSSCTFKLHSASSYSREQTKKLIRDELLSPKCTQQKVQTSGQLLLIFSCRWMDEQFGGGGGRIFSSYRCHLSLRYFLCGTICHKNETFFSAHLVCHHQSLVLRSRKLESKHGDVLMEMIFLRSFSVIKPMNSSSTQQKIKFTSAKTKTSWNFYWQAEAASASKKKETFVDSLICCEDVTDKT